MIEIIPAILTNNSDELVRLVHVFERAGVARVQLDICDGVFVPTHTVAGYEELKRLDTKLKFDVHLMVQNADAQCVNWCAVPHADRFLIHVETTNDFGALCGNAKECGKTLGAAINPETPLEKLEQAAAHTTVVQFLTVHSGKQGSAFLPDVLERIKTFRAAHPDFTIMVDGGINPDTAKQCIAAGANALVVGSYLTKALDIPCALEELRNAIA
jgi:ribulose-phosphate 3-epimerase